MPELPEVETTVKSLNILKNKKVINVDIHVKKLRYLVPHLDLKNIINYNIINIRRIAKYIIIDFEKEMVVIRNSLYHPYIATGERVINISGDLITEVNFPNTLPSTVGVGTNFYTEQFLYKIHKAIID